METTDLAEQVRHLRQEVLILKDNLEKLTNEVIDLRRSGGQF